MKPLRQDSHSPIPNKHVKFLSSEKSMITDGETKFLRPIPDRFDMESIIGCSTWDYGIGLMATTSVKNYKKWCKFGKHNNTGTGGRVTWTDSMDLSGTIMVFWISSIASPICQEGQSERTFPIFAFYSLFFLFFLIFPSFFLIFSLFPDFWHILMSRGALGQEGATPTVLNSLETALNESFSNISLLNSSSWAPIEAVSLPPPTIPGYAYSAWHALDITHPIPRKTQCTTQLCSLASMR